MFMKDLNILKKVYFNFITAMAIFMCHLLITIIFQMTVHLISLGAFYTLLVLLKHVEYNLKTTQYVS